MENCIHCKGKPNAQGYGRISIKNKVYFEHRVAYQKAHPKEDISKKIIHHICENPSCVNPKHLKGITRKEHSKEHGLTGIAKTHSERVFCKKGHPIEGRSERQRFCLICKRESANSYSKRNRAKLNEYKKSWRLKIKK